MKIKQTIYIILLVFTIIPVLFFGIFMVYENNQKIEYIMKQNLAAASGAQILDIENFCKGRNDNINILCQLDLVHDAIYASLGKITPLQEKEIQYLNNTLASRLYPDGYIESISIIDENYQVVSSTSEYEKGHLSDLKYANPKFLTGKFCISDILNPEDKGNELIAAIQGVYADEELIGYIVEEINLQFFEKIRKDSNLWEAGTLYILDGNGKMITAGNGTEESRQEFVLEPAEQKDFKDAWKQIDFNANPSGEISYMVGKERFITYYSSLQYSDWQMMLSVNLTVFQEQKKSYLILTVITVLAVFALFVILNGVISSKLTKPIHRIINLLKEIRTNQNYTLRIQDHGNDEIGHLASEINILLAYVETENEQEKERQRELQIKAEHDPLTGLYNGKVMEKKIESMIRECTGSGRKVAVAVLDMDDFKSYNTLYGHQGGDLVLRYVASELLTIKSGIAGRFGGDEFVIGIKDAENERSLAQTIETLISSLNRGFHDKYTGKPVKVSISLGIAVTGAGGQYEAVFQKADEALYEAKGKGKNTYVIYQM